MEIHKPKPFHNLREFASEIAVVVIGISIALAGEQAVEMIHHRQQLSEARRAIAEELATNIAASKQNLAFFRGEVVEYQGNLKAFQYMKQHPGAPMETLPAAIIWSQQFTSYSFSAWRTAHETGVLAYFPLDEARRLELSYQALSLVMHREAEHWDAVTEAEDYRHVDESPSQLSPAEIDRRIELCVKLLRTTYRLGVSMENVMREFPEYTGPTRDELRLALLPEAPMTPAMETLASRTKARIHEAETAGSTGQ